MKRIEKIQVTDSLLIQELEHKKQAVASLEKVLNQPALTQADLQDLKKRIKDVNNEAKEISDKKNVSNDPMEDKLTLFRQQAAIIARKKGNTVSLNRFLKNIHIAQRYDTCFSKKFALNLSPL